MARSLEDHNSFVLAQEDYLDPDRYIDGDGGEGEVHPVIRGLIDEYGGPRSLYRAIYKATPCGPMLGMAIDGEWRYGDELPESLEGGEDIYAISIQSIVEGSDVEVGPYVLEDGFTATDFWETVTEINHEASFYWDRDNCDWFSIHGIPGGEVCFGRICPFDDDVTVLSSIADQIQGMPVNEFASQAMDRLRVEHEGSVMDRLDLGDGYSIQLMDTSDWIY